VKHLPANPFATRFIRPGALPFLFPKGASAATLIERLREHGGWGQIIGPHGSGKSTLLATLVPALKNKGLDVRLVQLHEGERQVPREALSAVSPGTQLVIDGYEQLSWWSRRRLKAFCRRQKIGLLVTAHEDVGLPPLYQVEPSAAVAQLVVEQLLNGQPAQVSPAQVEAAFQKAEGNIREMLFLLYDTYVAAAHH
jgi:energy-coupling factor transporter ATP-binding protein EcfA2